MLRFQINKRTDIKEIFGQPIDELTISQNNINNVIK